jgi:hypothetical protein
MLNKETKEIQSQLADYCRTGEISEIKGAVTDRLHNYRRLVSNIIEDALQSTYPIAYDVLGDEVWNDLVYNFIKIHKPSNPQLWKMPFDLYDYVQQSGIHIKLNKPYLLDLLLFEWMEVQVHAMADADFESSKPYEGDVSNKIVVNPHFEVLTLEYPVFKVKGDDNIPEKGNYVVLVYRMMDAGSVQFMEFSPFLYAIFIRLTTDYTITGALNEVLKENNIPFEESMLTKISGFVNSLQEKGLVLGSLK